MSAIVPSLADNPDLGQPFWQQHTGSIAESLVQILLNQSINLIAHRGAGLLFLIIRQSLARPVSAYVFADAGLLRNNLSRIELMRFVLISNSALRTNTTSTRQCKSNGLSTGSLEYIFICWLTRQA